MLVEPNPKIEQIQRFAELRKSDALLDFRLDSRARETARVICKISSARFETMVSLIADETLFRDFR